MLWGSENSNDAREMNLRSKKEYSVQHNLTGASSNFYNLEAIMHRPVGYI